MTTGLERVLYTLACLVLPAPKGRRHKLGTGPASDDVVPIRAITARTHPYPAQEPTA
ncbi:hypothetical protein AB0395_47085 [Streptosporangium sp. NPDC051023]|uniref:hypothetical protein n=1 Tax=Streptosporangium sp. NPDC051023 TaxID=3155410 RepID=UPI00344D7353